MHYNTQNINIRVQSLSDWITGGYCKADVLRLDQVHPIVSGNKWFKLKYYLETALRTGRDTIASFGGAYSNHIVALAFAGKDLGFKTTGFIRGDALTPLSHTLLQARSYGMELVFTDRTTYRDKENIMQTRTHPNWYWVPEGGYGPEGARGAA